MRDGGRRECRGKVAVAAGGVTGWRLAPWKAKKTVKERRWLCLRKKKNVVGKLELGLCIVDLWWWVREGSPCNFKCYVKSIEGRYLKADDVLGVSSNNAETFKNTLVSTTGLLPPPPEPAIGHGVDVFRPTEPGHSPGVGHSIHN
ncbi:hypothetical protein PIB30_035192 [Stylosanthes scabra]|uniref:Uncharacterized protein n=1 Tax=Stylosanthes scabra TaxID=79078 RepID=A0ABU6QCK6_9FABA|nr:hypothetical protein [Stylosanthes scabra]